MLVLKYLPVVLFLSVFLHFCDAKSDNGNWTKDLNVGKLGITFLLSVDVCSTLSENPGQLRELTYTNARLAGGSNAGKYSKYVRDMLRGKRRICLMFAE